MIFSTTNEGRTGRVISRRQQKKTMKTLIRKLKEQAQTLSSMNFEIGFHAGVDAVLTAAHGLDYGEGYDVTTT